MARHRDEQLEPAVLVTPGEIIKEELEARGWTQKDLADIMRRPEQTISQIVTAGKQITDQTPLELAAAFGTSAQFWSNLEATYRLRLAAKSARDDAIARRSRLYSMLPIADVTKKGWIKACDDVAEMETEVCRFLGISDLGQPVVLAEGVCFRGSAGKPVDSLARVAWLKRVENLARETSVGRFSLQRLRGQGLASLLSLTDSPEGVGRVAASLADCGVCFFIVPHLHKTYLDGAAFPLGEKRVVAISLRYDRIDCFWFTLMHELAHLIRDPKVGYADSFSKEGAGTVDEAERDEGADPEEDLANRTAQDWLVPRRDYSNFVRKCRRRFSWAKIEAFAGSINRHPAIVLGRLMHDKHVGFNSHRRHLDKVSTYLQGQVSN